ncbi:serine/threonine protein kinase [Fusarium oxysporum]|nr:serine/threonine protein kinase [Fusarium oxysporum]
MRYEGAIEDCHYSDSATSNVSDHPLPIRQVSSYPASYVQISDVDGDPLRRKAVVADLLCTGPILSLAQNIGAWTNPIWLGNSAALRIDQLSKGVAGTIAVSELTEQMRQCLDLQDRSCKAVVFKRIRDREESIPDTYDRRKRHQEFLREALILCHSPIKDHQHIVRLHAIFFEQDGENHNMSWPVMVQEYATEGTLSDFILNRPSVSFQILQPLLRDIAYALFHLHHACLIAHGDIKPDNIYILWDSEKRKLSAKLGGFQSARYGQNLEDRLQLPRGTHPWAAPECHRNGDNLVPLSDIMSADIYSYVLVVFGAAIEGPDVLFWSRNLRGRLGGDGQQDLVEQERYSAELTFLLSQNARQGVDRLEIHKLLQFGLAIDPRNRDGRSIMAIMLETDQTIEEGELFRSPIPPFDSVQACASVQRLETYPICVQNNVIHEWEIMAQERPINKQLALQIANALLNGCGNYTDAERSTKAYNWLDHTHVHACFDGNVREALWPEEAALDGEGLLDALRSCALTGDPYALIELRARLDLPSSSRGQSATESINLDEPEYEMGVIKEIAHSLPAYDSQGGDCIYRIVYTLARHGRDDDAIWLLNEVEGQIVEWKTALHFAISRNNIPAVESLLKRPGLNPYKWYDPRTTNGPTYSAFCLAVQLNLVDVMRMIVERYPLWPALTASHSVDGCSVSVCHCCDPNCVDPATVNGENYLMAALDPGLRVDRMRIHGSRYQDAMNETVKLLHEMGVRMWPKPTGSWAGRSDVIDIAAEFLRGNLSVVRVLLQHNATEVLKGEVNGFPFLHLAASAGHRDLAIVEEICMAGVDLSLRDSYGRTALELAILEGFFSMADRLVELGAILDSCNGDGITSFGKFLQMPGLPLDRIKYFLREAATKQLPDPLCCRQVERNVFHVVAASNRRYMAKSRLMSLWRELMIHRSVYGPWINKLDRFGFTPLMLAVLYGHQELVILLLEDGADTNAFGVTNAITLAEMMLRRVEYLQRKTENTRESRLTRKAIEDWAGIVRVLQERGSEAKYSLLGLPKVDYQKLSSNFNPSNIGLYIKALTSGLEYFGSHGTATYQESDVVSFYQRILNPPDIAALMQGSAEYFIITSLDPFTAVSKPIFENPFVETEFAGSVGLVTGECQSSDPEDTTIIEATQTWRNLDINLASLAPLFLRLAAIVLRAGTHGPAGVASRAALTLITHWIIHEQFGDGRRGLRLTQDMINDLYGKIQGKLRGLPVVGSKLAELMDESGGGSV